MFLENQACLMYMAEVVGKNGIIKLNEGLPKFLRVFREGLPGFFGELMRVLREGFS